ncbi:unnamed protein product [Nesidiocoris tenuis]|uniref:sphingomyelin phosphodiesterase n=1 Tax=Nesidiocoris tenuis TaxID=355587 RepID=A0A6H5FWT8_9HEMI|nr:unnamed protein product [Nesidiocoris tenuis]
MEDLPTSIRLNVFTMNIWGMPLGLSKDRGLRINALADALKSKDYDIIALQEVWDIGDFNLIFSSVEKAMPYKYYFYSGLFGSGLGVISKWPIVETFYYKFPLNGYVHKLQHGDWLAGKGVALAQINVNGKLVNVFNTHLHAQYSVENDEYLSHRLSQAYEAGQLVRLTSAGFPLTLFLGDLNSKPTDVCLRLLVSLAGLHDSFLDRANEKNYGTNESARNSYSPKALLKTNPDGGRLDYILFKCDQNHEATALSYSFALPERIPGSDVSYSDHEAVEACIELRQKSIEPDGVDGGSDSTTEAILRESIDVCERGLRQVATKIKWLKVCSLLTSAIIGILVLAQIEHDDKLSSFKWFLLYSPCFIFSTFLAADYIFNRIEFQSLCSIQNAIRVLRRSMSSKLTPGEIRKKDD